MDSCFVKNENENNQDESLVRPINFIVHQIPKYSLRHVQQSLSELLLKNAQWCEDLIVAVYNQSNRLQIKPDSASVKPYGSWFMNELSLTDIHGKVYDNTIIVVTNEILYKISIGSEFIYLYYITLDCEKAEFLVKKLIQRLSNITTTIDDVNANKTKQNDKLS